MAIIWTIQYIIVSDLIVKGRQTEKRDQPSHKIYVSFCVHFYRQTVKTVATKLKSIYFCVDRQKEKQIYEAMQYFILCVLLLSVLFAEVPFWCQTQTHGRLLPGLPSPAPQNRCVCLIAATAQHRNCCLPLLLPGKSGMYFGMRCWTCC